MKELKDKKLRPPVVQGIFYPSSGDELRELITSYTKDRKKGTAPLIVTPHGGYNAAGQQMADAFMAAADRKIKEVVIISPVHREEQDKIIVPSFNRFSTAAGVLEINMKSLHMFMGEESSIIRDDIPHLEEHAIEDQLPFISTFFDDVKILPILLGKTTISMVKKLTKALKRAYGDHMDDVLFVITSNLSNYEKDKAALAKADRALDLFQNGDWRVICEEKRTGLIDACGAGPLASILALYSRPLTMELISRSVSEGKESEKGKIVSYGAIVFRTGD